MSKGSVRRPAAIDDDTMTANWAAIFNPKGESPETEESEGDEQRIERPEGHD